MRYVTRLFVHVTQRNSRLLFCLLCPMAYQEQDAYCSFFSVSVYVCMGWLLRCYHTVCSLSALLPLGISVFLTALLSFNNMPPALHRGVKTLNNNSSCNCICMWYCEVCGHGKTECTCLCSFWFRVCMDLLPLMRFVFFLLCVCSFQSRLVHSVCGEVCFLLTLYGSKPEARTDQ